MAEYRISNDNIAAKTTEGTKITLVGHGVGILGETIVGASGKWGITYNADSSEKVRVFALSPDGSEDLLEVVNPILTVNPSDFLAYYEPSNNVNNTNADNTGSAGFGFKVNTEGSLAELTFQSEGITGLTGAGGVIDSSAGALDSALRLRNDMSAMIRVKLNAATGSTQQFISFHGGGETFDVNYLWSVMAQSNNALYYFTEWSNGQNIPIYTKPLLTIGQFHTIAFTRVVTVRDDNDQEARVLIKMYFDGEMVYQDEVRQSTGGSSSALKIGAAWDTNQGLNGVISNFAITDRVLSDNDIKTIHNEWSA